MELSKGALSSKFAVVETVQKLRSERDALAGNESLCFQRGVVVDEYLRLRADQANRLLLGERATRNTFEIPG